MGESEDATYLTDFEALLTLVVAGMSCVLSTFGSASIIYLIAKTTDWRRSIFLCIMMGASVSDLVNSTGGFAHPFMLPPETGLIFALGNSISCNVAGFITMLVPVSGFYSFVLSTYFFLTIARGWREERLQSLLQPWCHITSWGAPIILAGIAFFLDGYRHSAMGVCLIDTNGEHGQVASILLSISYLFMILPAIVGFVLIWLMFSVVRKLRQRSQRYACATDREHDKQTQEVAVQAMFYSLAFVNTFVAALLSAVITSAATRMSTKESGMKKDIFFYMSLLIYVICPLQGFFNWVIYVRPKLLRWKRSKLDVSWWWAYQQVLSGSPAPRGVSVSASSLALEQAPEPNSVDNE